MTQPVIRVCNEISPRVLVQKYTEGHAVYRTSHLGNQYPSNLFLAALGLPICLYDKTKLWTDTNYHPSGRIANGVYERIVSQADIGDDPLVPFAVFPDDSPLKPLWHTPAHYHFRTLAGLFPELVTTEAELFLRHEEKILRVLEIVEDHNPVEMTYQNMLAMSHYVLECGCRSSLARAQSGGWWTSCRHTDRKEIARGALAREAVSFLHTLRGLVFEPEKTHRRGGAVPSLPLAQAIFMMVCWWESGKSDMYELSGPDLVRYGTGRNFFLPVRSVFETLDRYGEEDFDLPPRLTLHIVPTIDLRFGYVEGSVASEQVVRLYDGMLETQKRKREAMRQAGEDADTRFEVAKQFDPAISRMKTDVRTYLPQWDIFYDIHDGSFFSHHDLQAGQRLVIPDSFLDMPFGAMRKVVERMNALIKS